MRLLLQVLHPLLGPLYTMDVFGLVGWLLVVGGGEVDGYFGLARVFCLFEKAVGGIGCQVAQSSRYSFLHHTSPRKDPPL
jgi:hypothetical protein